MSFTASISAEQVKDLLSRTRNSTIYTLTHKHADKPSEILKVVRLQNGYNEAKYHELAASLSEDVVKIHSAYRSSSEFHIRMEFCSSGTLSNEILQRARQKRPWKAQELQQHALTLTRVVSRLHSQQVAHRDIKPDNVLLSDSGTLKLSDFGSSGRTEAAERHGTCIYMSPELHYWRSHTVNYCAADSFSLGKTLYEMATLHYMDDLYSYYHDETAYNARLNSALHPVSEEVRSVIQGLMAFDPMKRWSCARANAFLDRKVNLSATCESLGQSLENSNGSTECSGTREASNFTVFHNAYGLFDDIIE